MTNSPVRAVIDTNVVVSAALKPSSLPDFVVSAGIGRVFTICYSEPILAEYRDVLGRGKFSFSRTLVDALLADIESAGRQYRPVVSLAVCRDPRDDKFLECAGEAKADYLVTGNTRHFPPRHHGTDVVTPRQFVTLLLSIGKL